MKTRILSVAATAALPLAALAGPVEQGPPNVPDAVPAFAGQTRAPEDRSGVGL